MSEDKRRIRNEDELRDFFHGTLAGNPSPRTKRMGIAGVVVDTELRREVMTGINEGRIVISGRVLDFEFKSMGGGVWRCTIPVQLQADMAEQLTTDNQNKKTMKNQILEQAQSAALAPIISSDLLGNDFVKNVEDNSDERMKRLRLTFTNDYGISIIQGSTSYGGEEGLYEIAPLNKNGSLDGSYLDEDDQGDDVLGHLDEKQVEYYIRKMANL